MTNNEIVKEIEESIRLINQTKTTVNDALCHARNVVQKDDKAIEEAYNKGLIDGRNEAWELIKKLCTISSDSMIKIFGMDYSALTIVGNFTPQEVIAKVEAYEKEQNKIKVGDVVYISDISNIELQEKDKKAYGVVTRVYENNHYEILMENGDYMSFVNKEIKKTDKHTLTFKVRLNK